MTFGQNKKICLALIEEYSPNNKYLTDDEDIQNRIALLYAPAYQELSQNKKIVKSKEYIMSNEASEGYTQYSLPSNCYQVKNVYALDDNNSDVSVDYKIRAKKILISNKTQGRCIVEYYAYPSIITEETEDDFNLEIDQDAQFLLPYLVANDILKSDQSSNYADFATEYQRKLEQLDTRTNTPLIVVKEMMNTSLLD